MMFFVHFYLLLRLMGSTDIDYHRGMVSFRAYNLGTPPIASWRLNYVTRGVPKDEKKNSNLLCRYLNGFHRTQAQYDSNHRMDAHTSFHEQIE